MTDMTELLDKMNLTPEVRRQVQQTITEHNLTVDDLAAATDTAGRLNLPVAVYRRQQRRRRAMREMVDDLSSSQYVSLDQIAALCNRSKRTLERWLATGKKVGRTVVKLPDPDVPGGGGDSHEWRWERVRKTLEKLTGRKMPEQFPRIRENR